MTESDGNAAPSAPETLPGRMLTEARVRKNLTILDVAQQLKLSISQVEALEADAYDRLPGPVFVRGFVRNYARLVDLDGEVLTAALVLPSQHTTASAAVPHSSNIPFPEQHPSTWPRYAAVLLLLMVGVLALYAFMTDERQVVVTAQTPAEYASTAAAVQSVAVAEPVPAEHVIPKPTSGEVSAPSVADARPVAAENTQSSGIAEVHFTFNKESWVEVRDRNNRILLSELSPAGSEQRLQGRAPLTLVVGNARGVRLDYNGAPIDLTQHTRESVARLTLE